MKSKRKTDKFRIIFRFLKGNIRFLVGTLVFSVLFTACNALIPQIVKYTADHILVLDGIPDGLNVRQALLLAAILVVAAAVLSGIFNYLSKMCLAKGSENFLKSIRDTLYHHTQYLPFSWHVQHQTGEIIQRCTSDVEVIRNFVCRQLPEVFRICFLIILYLGIMFSMNVPITLAAAAFFPVIIGYSAFFHSRIGKRFQDADEAEGALSSTVQENLTGVRVVRAFGREKYEIDRFDQKNNAYSDLWVYLGKLMSVFWASGDLITNLQVLTVMVLGVVFAVEGRITLGEFIAFLSYNASLTWPVRSLGRIISDMSKAGVSMERVAYILEAEEEDATDANNKPALTGDICFRNVSFAYSLDHPILKNINFTIPAGSTFAILGTTGSGKSTLVHLLNRLYDLPEGCGSITIGGTDIRDIDRQYLRQNIGMVLQEPFLFSRTIRENIGITKEKLLDEEIRHAAEIACVDESIQHFTDGYDTIVGERGVTLSGGQKQRVAIARMLMKQAPVLVFDDSLSAVDTETDNKIRKELKKEMEKATVIMISHRITSLMQADCIIVMDKGEIQQMGTHDQLIQQEGPYKDIYEIQMNSDIRLMEGGAVCE
ncbi:Putative multidrug export ATP-binding/permease protein SAV1866 [uncultured Blautia sp.]|uniref:ABC transporter ATP-binding protein n=1 Tax=Blautia acetigignens TaxID=2981783 RepID=UPI0008215F23|nr:ABC transporter ATP-binding protein [Blautia acetigignens]MCU6775971.1 ABC transporter ATP-binding protein/permease [Blautia acetigignens]SCH97022.1 Putative multidrug export ATP-binding/permease protein SAV1866 [uncultured Blautia sp.]